MILGIIEALAFSIAVSFYLRIPLGAGFMLYPCAVIVCLFASDFIGVLQTASYFIHVITILMTLGWARCVWAGGLWRKIDISPRHIVIGVVCVFALIQVALLCSTREFYSWDEFSHWGTVVRLIYEANTFHLFPNPLYFQDYPPGLALFSFHVLQISGYSEGNAYFSYALLLGCFSASLVQLAARGTLLGALAAIVIIWCSVDVLGPGWASLLVDHVLAFFFSGIIATYYLMRESGSRMTILPIFLGAFSLTKQAAFSFALLASAIIVADWVASRLHKSAGSRRWYSPSVWLPAAGLLLSLIGAAVLTSETWKYYVLTRGLEVGWGTYSPGSHVLQFLNCCQSARELGVTNKFFAAYFDAQRSPEIPGSIAHYALAAIWGGGWWELFKRLFSAKWLISAPGMTMMVLSVASLSLVVLSSSRVDRWRNATFGALMVFGGAGYTLSLLLTYLYAFSEYEADTLASFDRFFSVYLLAWLLSLVAVAFATLNHAASKATRQGHLILGLLTCVVFFSNITHARPILSPAAYQAAYQDALHNHRLPGRDSIREWVADFSKDLPLKARVFILWPKTTGLEFWLTKHELLPRMTNLTCFAITQSISPALVQECTMSELRARKMLENYDFVAVGDQLDAIQREYPSFFAETTLSQKRAVFRIVTTPNFRLIPYSPSEANSDGD